MAQLTSETTKTSSLPAKPESKVRDTLGENLLHIAIAKRDATTVASLLGAQANINSQDLLGDTPIQIAARVGDVPVIEVLLKARANAHSRTSDNSTLLHIVARTGNAAAITCLIKANVNPNLRDQAGDTPLMSATLKEHIPAIIALIKEKANIDLSNPAGNTALMCATLQGHIPIINTLIKEKATIDLRNHNELSALHIAVCMGNVEVVNELIEARADITPPDITGGETPLLTAADKGFAAIVTALLKAKAPADSKTNDGDYALHFATRNGNIETIATLLKANANLNSKNKNGHTPLHSAIFYRKTAAIEALMEAKADVALTNNFGDAPIHVAASNGSVATIVSLLEAKAPVQTKNGFGNNALHVAAATENAPVIPTLLAAKIDLHSEDPNQRTAVHVAAIEGSHQAIAALCEAKADLNIRDSLGDTPLLLAVKHQKIAAVRILMKHKANANLKDNRGMEALQHTTKVTKPEEALTIVKLLLGVNEEASPLPSALRTLRASTSKKTAAAASLPITTRKKDEELRDEKVNIAAAPQDQTPSKQDIKDAKSPANLSWEFSSGSQKVNLALEQTFSAPKTPKNSLLAPKKKSSTFNKHDEIPHTTYIISIVNQAFRDIANEKYNAAEKKLLSALARLKERASFFKKNKTADPLQYLGEISCNYYLSLCAKKTAHLENEQLYGNNLLGLLPKAINLLAGNEESPQFQQLQRIKVEFETRKLALQENIRIKKASLAKTLSTKKNKTSLLSTIPAAKPPEESAALPEVAAEAPQQEDTIAPPIPESVAMLPAVSMRQDAAIIDADTKAQQQTTMQLTQKIMDKEQYLLALINGKAPMDDMDIESINQQIKTLSQDLTILVSPTKHLLQSRIIKIATYAKTISEIFNTKKQVTKHINDIEKNITHITHEITTLCPSDASGNIDLRRRQLIAASRAKYTELEEWQNKLAKLLEIIEAYAENPAPPMLPEAKIMQSSPTCLATVILPAAAPSSLPSNNEIMPRNSRPSVIRMPYRYPSVAPLRQSAISYTPPSLHNGPRQFFPQPIYPAATPIPIPQHYAPAPLFGMTRPILAFSDPRHSAQYYPAGSYAQMSHFLQPQQILRPVAAPDTSQNPPVHVEPKASSARRSPPPGLSLPPISTTPDNKQSPSFMRDSSRSDLQIGRVSTGKGSSFFIPAATSTTIAKEKEKIQDAPLEDASNPASVYSS